MKEILRMQMTRSASVVSPAARMMRATAAGVAAAVLASAGSAVAASFTATTTPIAATNNCSGLVGGSSATPLSAFAACSVPGLMTTAEAHSGFGKVGAAASASGGGNAVGLAVFSDTVRFTSTDPGASFATVALQLELSGFLTGTAGAFDINNPAANGVSSILAQAFFNGSGPLTFERTSVSDRTGIHDASFQNTFSAVTGDPRGSALDLILVTQSFFVPLNRDISYAFLIQAGGSAFGPVSAASSEFAHTFGLPTGRDVFVLPEGVTANAGDYLVNNRFGASSVAVPEPTAWTIMLLGFGLVGTVLRSRRGTQPSTSRKRLVS